MAENQRWQGGGGRHQQHGNNPRQQDDQPRMNFKDQFKPEWITDRIDKDAVVFANDFGGFLKKDLKSSQIRSFFGEVKRLEFKSRIQKHGVEFINEDEFVRDFLLLGPKIAYSAQRQDTDGYRQFKEVMFKAIKYVNTDQKKGVEKKHFDNFVDLFEAIIAFHKAAGGK